MSTVKANSHQIGQSATATNNFTWYQPSSPDGTVRLAVGNAGATTLDTVTVNSSGNVGIGTSSPQNKLHVYGDGTGSLFKVEASNTNGTASINLVPNGAGNGQIYTGSGALLFSPGIVERMRLDSSGNLGLGVTPLSSGTTAFEVKGGGDIGFQGNGNISANAYYSSGSYKYATSSTAVRYNMNGASAGGHAWFTAPSGTAGNTISFTQAMTLDASGRLLIGTTTPVSGYGIALGDGSSSTGIYAKCNGGGVVYAGLDPVNQPNNGFYIGHLSSTSQLQMRCGGSGGVYLSSGGTSWGSLSDERLKTNLKAITKATEKVLALRAVTGRYIVDEESVSRSFLIAQDVQSVFPEAVNAENPEELGVRYTDTIPLLVAAIKELSAELNELKAKVNA